PAARDERQDAFARHRSIRALPLNGEPRIHRSVPRVLPRLRNGEGRHCPDAEQALHARPSASLGFSERARNRRARCNPGGRGHRKAEWWGEKKLGSRAVSRLWWKNSTTDSVSVRARTHVRLVPTRLSLRSSREAVG